MGFVEVPVVCSSLRFLGWAVASSCCWCHVSLNELLSSTFQERDSQSGFDITSSFHKKLGVDLDCSLVVGNTLKKTWQWAQCCPHSAHSHNYYWEEFFCHYAYCLPYAYPGGWIHWLPQTPPQTHDQKHLSWIQLWGSTTRYDTVLPSYCSRSMYPGMKTNMLGPNKFLHPTESNGRDSLLALHDMVISHCIKVRPVCMHDSMNLWRIASLLPVCFILLGPYCCACLEALKFLEVNLASSIWLVSVSCA